MFLTLYDEEYLRTQTLICRRDLTIIIINPGNNAWATFSTPKAGWKSGDSFNVDLPFQCHK